MTRLRRNFIEQFQCLKGGSDSSAFDIHIRNVERFRGHWVRTFNADTCLLCVRRVPDGPRLSCGHRLCRVCIQVAGQNTPADPCSFQFPGNKCPLCGSRLTAATIGFVPPTAAIRVLSVDGGGVKGVSPLKVLDMVERRIKVTHLGSRSFDFGIGSSAGERSSLFPWLRPPLGRDFAQCRGDYLLTLNAVQVRWYRVLSYSKDGQRPDVCWNSSGWPV